ncbi:MAG: hypothetical protein O3C69_03620 [Chloroflexi bacterium]|nr:hypothetical protein [Chloroflexota bacterium]
MSYGDPDSQDIMRELQKMQKQLEEIQRSNRLFSPEHIAQASGYVLIKNDLTEIKQLLANLSRRLGAG